MMGEIILLTFYNRQTEANPSWEVYSHIAPSINNMVARFKTRDEAIAYCFDEWSTIPVLEGHVADWFLKKLYDGKPKTYTKSNEEGEL